LFEAVKVCGTEVMDVVTVGKIDGKLWFETDKIGNMLEVLEWEVCVVEIV
jgi:hypothetical protein